ncbi:MAG: hypothetical protein M3529_14310 [Actinomycetota bacterium]|nr:hypothetical protein [Actinomycetota bacterium]
MAKSSVGLTARRRPQGWDVFSGVDILTQATTLAGAAQSAQDFLASVHGGEPADYDVEVVVDLGGTEKKVEQVRDQMRRAQEDLQRAAVEWRTVALHLRDVEKLPARDAAQVLGISAGRYSQLVTAAPS